METNNKNFKSMKLNFLFMIFIYFLLCITIYLYKIEYIYPLLVLLFLSIIITYYNQYQSFKKIYTDIRKVINSIDSHEALFMEGDIGLLYDRIVTLNRRIDGYSKRILKEKENLKNTIEDICHQMKTPLSIVSINNELLLETINNEKLLKNQRQINKMKNLISNLLAIAKIENNAVNFEFQKLPVNYIINLSLLNIDAMIDDKKIYNYVDNVEFYYDESWLQEAIVNIIKNDLEQSSVQNIYISNEVIGGYIKIYIEDDGEGIDEKDIRHIFERFYKGKNQNKESVGIGLSLAKEIIKAHHGYIKVYNKKGACFELTFPLLMEMSDKIE